jgi:hypothetical protein
MESGPVPRCDSALEIAIGGSEYNIPLAQDPIERWIAVCASRLTAGNRICGSTTSRGRWRYDFWRRRRGWSAPGD